LWKTNQANKGKEEFINISTKRKKEAKKEKQLLFLSYIFLSTIFRTGQSAVKTQGAVS
jgi:thiamine monophosphate synthase